MEDLMEVPVELKPLRHCPQRCVSKDEGFVNMGGVVSSPKLNSAKCLCMPTVCVGTGVVTGG